MVVVVAVGRAWAPDPPAAPEAFGKWKQMFHKMAGRGARTPAHSFLFFFFFFTDC